MDSTIIWLHESTKSRFAHPKKVNALVENALAQHTTLQPKIAEYISENGVKEALLCLHGTLTVPFRGSSFNIPVMFWLPRGFPETPPMSFVKPTQKMIIKISNHVDGRGRVYHPYMNEWSSTSTLVELFQNLIVLFSNEPPVYTARAPNNALTASPQMALGSASMSTLPHAATASMSSLASVGTMSMNSLPQSLPASMSIPINSGSPHRNSTVPYPPTFVRPVSSVEHDLASINVPAPAGSHNALPPSPMHLQQGLSASAGAAENAIAKLSVNDDADKHSLNDSASGTSSQTPKQQNDSVPQKNSYKFNPVAGRPPIPNLHSPTSASNPQSTSTNTAAAVAAVTAVAADTTTTTTTTASGTSTTANLNPDTSTSGARRNSYASESDTTSERAKRWSTTDSALSFTEDLDDEQTPLNALSATLPASTTIGSIAATSTAAENTSPPTVALGKSHSGASVTPTTATASSVPISSPNFGNTVASSARPRLQSSSLLDDEPMDDPQKRLLGYQLAMLDKVTEAVDKSREKHTRVNKELLDQSANLNSGAGVIAEERHQLLESQRQLSANISVLENKLNELNEKKNEFPDVSQIKDVCQIFRGQTPAMEQLFNLAGEISAIDDTIYMLGKALNDGKLPVSIYMRQIRKLAQQQFMAKALALKIRELCFIH